MRILMLGAGAVGGYYGARLVQAGADVTFLVRERRARQLRADGLVVRSETETMRLASPRVVTAPERPYDIVFLSCKAYDLAAAIDAIAPAVGESSLIVPLVNGVAQFDALDARFGPARIAGGSCHLSGTLEDDGTVRLYAPIHRIVYGVREGNHAGAAAMLGELHAFFSKTPVPAVLSDDIMQELWDKYVMLCAVAAMTCLMRASVGDIMQTERGRTYALEMLETCIRVAGHAGYRPSPEVVRGSEEWLTAPGSTFMASMLRDVERGRPTEAEHIVGDMVRRARVAGIDAALLEVAYCHLQAYEARRRREAGRARGTA